MKKREIRKLLRNTIQIIYFIWMPALYTSAFSAVRYVIEQMRVGKPLEWNGFLATFVALCGFTIIFGRFFCGYICAFGTLGDGMYQLTQSVLKKINKRRKKKNLKPLRILWISETLACKLQKMKYLLLISLIVIYALGKTDFFQGSSPWEVFSLLYRGNLLDKEHLLGFVIFVYILVQMCKKERFFCQYLCPMGAIFSWLPVLPFSSLDRNRSDCIPKCRACQMKCPVDMQVKRDQKCAGECIHCYQCMDVCPKQNIHLGLGKRWKGNEIGFIIIKLMLFTGLCLCLQKLT